MLDDVRSINVTKSTLVTFADDLTESIMVKGRHPLCPHPQEVESVRSWAEDNLVTINLTKTKEMVVRGKTEKPLPSIIFYIERESLFKPLGVYFHSDSTNWDQQFDNLLSNYKAGRRMHILRVCKKYGYS